MKIDAALLVHDLNQMPAVARFADDAGFNGIWTFETAHEPFLPLVLAAEHSSHMSLGTSIAVAFEIKERHKLPSPPVVVTKVINMLKNPDFNVRELSRVIADDPSLASQTLSCPARLVTRSVFNRERCMNRYSCWDSKRCGISLSPRRLQVLCPEKTKFRQKLWTHSLAVALAGAHRR